MIVRMAKVEIVGPKDLLMEVLDLVRELGIFQIEPEIRGFVAEEEEARVRSLALDEKIVTERLFYEDLRAKIDDLLACLPPLEVRESWLEPAAVIDAVAASLEKHAALYGELFRKREALRKEAQELGRYTEFLTALETLLEGVETKTGLDFIGVTIREKGAVEHLTEALARLTRGKFEIVTAEAAGTIFALIVVPGGMAELVRRVLSEERVPELAFPPPFGELPFPEKILRIRERLSEIGRETGVIDGELEKFARRWSAIYRRVRGWLDGKLSLLRTSAYVHETGMCFFVHGWMPAAEVAGLGRRLGGKFGDRVVVEEKLIKEEELEEVPVALKNPPYFRPFELFARLLPLPRYTSYDPTPFIGIFFPLFFGMMLGDAGHGAVLLVAALVLQKRFRERRYVRDAALILLISSLYAILFGFFYGELFGEFGHELFGLRPLITERRTAIVPMLFFALSVGVMHVVFGLLLGASSAFKRKTGKEAFFKLLTILVILCLVVLFGSLAVPTAGVLVKPVLITLGVAVPFLLFTGGLMAPLELVKTIGNIISYVRIMAIGLTSVFLSTVANNLAGMTGNIVTGTIVAGLIHGLAIIIGVFSPTIQSLRLHYVEFFSKFIEHGGRRFEPLKK